jgi:hypothetical protein
MISDVAIYRRVNSNLGTYPLVTGGGINAGLYGSAQVRLGGGTSGSKQRTLRLPAISARRFAALRHGAPAGQGRAPKSPRAIVVDRLAPVIVFLRAGYAFS